MLDRKLRQDVYIRVCKDSGFQLDNIRATILSANILKCHPFEIYDAFSGFDVMQKISTGNHPVCEKNS